MGEFINILDFRKLLDTILGSSELYLFAFIIIFSYVCAKLNMSNKIFLTLLVLCSLIMSVVLGQAIYILIIFITGFVVFKSIADILT